MIYYHYRCQSCPGTTLPATPARATAGNGMLEADGRLVKPAA